MTKAITINSELMGKLEEQASASSAEKADLHEDLGMLREAVKTLEAELQGSKSQNLSLQQALARGSHQENGRLRGLLKQQTDIESDI